MRGHWRCMALGTLLLLALTNGCAMQPSTNNINGFTGPRLVVKMTYQGNQLTGSGINPYYYYFFVINYAAYSRDGKTLNLAGNPQAPGPVPIVAPGPSPNGFVIGNDGSTYGFSDYVEYNPGSQPLGYGLYHIQHTPTTSDSQAYLPVPEGAPVQFVNPSGGNTLQFTLYLSQLIQAVQTAQDRLSLRERDPERVEQNISIDKRSKQ